MIRREFLRLCSAIFVPIKEEKVFLHPHWGKYISHKVRSGVSFTEFDGMNFVNFPVENILDIEFEKYSNSFFAFNASFTLCDSINKMSPEKLFENEVRAASDYEEKGGVAFSFKEHVNICWEFENKIRYTRKYTEKLVKFQIVQVKYKD